MGIGERREAFKSISGKFTVREGAFTIEKLEAAGLTVGGNVRPLNGCEVRRGRVTNVSLPRRPVELAGGVDDDQDEAQHAAADMRHEPDDR